MSGCLWVCCSSWGLMQFNCGLKHFQYDYRKTYTYCSFTWLDLIYGINAVGLTQYLIRAKETWWLCMLDNTHIFYRMYHFHQGTWSLVHRSLVSLAYKPCTAAMKWQSKWDHADQLPTKYISSVSAHYQDAWDPTHCIANSPTLCNCVWYSSYVCGLPMRGRITIVITTGLQFV